MNDIEKLTKLFSDFPGIGPRQAKRFVYFLLTRPSGYLAELTSLLKELKSQINICTNCYRFFSLDASHSSVCSICRNEHRDKTRLMIVSKDVDLETIEKSKSYDGLYFVLGGTVPILEKNPQSRIRATELKRSVEMKIKNDGLKEIILAMNLNPEGENTEEYVRGLLKEETENPNSPIKISILGRGLSTGTELEYSDSETIKNALKNRF